MTFDEWWDSMRDQLYQNSHSHNAARMAWAYAQLHAIKPAPEEQRLRELVDLILKVDETEDVPIEIVEAAVKLSEPQGDTPK